MKRWILNKLLRYLFNAVTEDEILQLKPGGLFRNKRPLTNAEVAELQSGAEALKQMYIFQQLMTEMKHVANKRMYESSQSFDDMMFGKAMLYTIDVMEKKIDNLSKLK